VKKLFTSFLILILFSLSVYGNAQPPSSIQIYFFYTEDCQPCQTILQGYLPSLKAMFPSLEIKTFDVGNPKYFEALSQLEKRFNRGESQLPVVMIGDHFLSGEMEVMEKLNPLLLEYQAKGGASLPPIEISPIPASPNKTVSTLSTELTYFYQKGCPKCDRANALLK
jgi:thiol-disulfide isomerase/thioredoxin